jgi:hypothetical protein
MKLDNQVEDCKSCDGAGKVLRSVHNLPPNVCTNEMYHDLDLYRMNQEPVKCGTCKGIGYIPKK